ncbi:MAG: hypothetical protein LQ337_004407 [Flavoplaca oasis]|nr:MAG: hypothetical protein LQ337_004407 [Flavoplaca oasis]
MLRLQELDELDRQVEEDAKAQRREYTRRQEGVKPQGWLEPNGTSSAAEDTAVRVDHGDDAMRHHAQSDEVSNEAATKLDSGSDGGTLHTTPVTLSIGEHSALGLSSDDTLSDPPSILADEPPVVPSGASSTGATNNSRSAVYEPLQPIDRKTGDLRSANAHREVPETVLPSLIQACRDREHHVPSPAFQSPEPGPEPGLGLLDQMPKPSAFAKSRATTANIVCKAWARTVGATSIGWRYCRAAVDNISTFISYALRTLQVPQPLQRMLGKIGMILLYVLVGSLAMGLTIEFSARIGISILDGVTSLTAGVDSLSSELCQTRGIGWICLFWCNAFPMVSSSLLPRTCSRGSLKSPEIDVLMDFNWDANFKINLNGDNIIPNKFSECRTNCSQYGPKIKRVRRDFGVPEQEQDTLYERLPRICTMLESIPVQLPWYRRYVAFFSEALLQHINKTEADIEKASNGAEIDPQTKSDIIQRLPAAMSLWRERYEEIEGPGSRLEKEIADAGEFVGNTMDEIERVTFETNEKKKAILRRWPLARRLGRALGLLPHDPDELSRVNQAIKALNLWYQELRVVRNLLLVAELSVRDLKTPLADLATNAWDKDLTIQQGDGMRKIKAFYGEMRYRAQEVSQSASGREDDIHER